MRSILIVLTLPLAALPAWAKDCSQVIGQPVRISGMIEDALINIQGAARYTLLPGTDFPYCNSIVSVIVDPRGQLRCHKGQRITATGIVSSTQANGDAQVEATNYYCK